MHCNVCHATSAEGYVCPQCGYDFSAPGAGDPLKVMAAREAFRNRSTAYAPDTRVTRRDKLTPWFALLVGLALFVFWVRTCLR